MYLFSICFTPSFKELKNVATPGMRAWWSCVTQSTGGGWHSAGNSLLQQSLAGNKCYGAGERITELDCQGEEGRAGSNRQSKTKPKRIRTCLRSGAEFGV